MTSIYKEVASLMLSRIGFLVFLPCYVNAAPPGVVLKSS